MKHTGRDINGILLLDKSTGITSNKALQQAKRLFDAKKAGHTGSLDPIATGLLPICFGEATKLTQYLLNARKQYLADICLGEVTDTGDRDGMVIHSTQVPQLTQIEILTLIEGFVGESKQIPPMYSALSVGGKRLYKLARQGITVERKARDINIDEIRLVQYQSGKLQLLVTCSKGTYIRSLAQDIGEKIGCGAHITELRRTGVDPFFTTTMHSIESLKTLSKQSLDKVLRPIDQAVQHLPRVTLHFDQGKRLVHGLTVAETGNADELVRLYMSDDVFLGIGQYSGDQLKAKRLVNTERFR